MAALLGALALLSGFGQDPDAALQERIRLQAQDLSSDDPQVRERASAELKRVGPSALPALEKLAADSKDLETRLRILGVIRDLWILKSEALFGDRRLQDALLALATAENPGDPQRHREKRIDEARKDLAPLLSRPGEEKRVRDLPSSAKALREKHGRWALPALLDCLNPKATNCPGDGIELLKYWGGDSIPPLLAALKEKDEKFVHVVCEALHALGRGYPAVLKEFSKLAQDPSRSERLRTFAEGLLTDLGGRVEKP